MTLTPLIATLIFVVGILAGHSYRRVWKAEGPVWQLWVFGGLAGACLGIVAFIPMEY
ncbi:MAG: hypothetical protein AAF213_07605 [Pseudomonadota bacterium]